MADIFLLRRSSSTGGGASTPNRVTDSDRAFLGGLVRSSSGAATLFDDSNTTSITIGGGSALSGAQAVKIDAGTAGANVEAGTDITFDARGMTSPITLNETGDLDLDPAFTSTSIVGALNELAGGLGSTAGLGTFESALLESACDPITCIT